MKKLLIPVTFFLITLTNAYAGMIDDAVKKGALKVGLTPTYMPFEMTNRKGETVGFEIDILKAMTKALGVKLELIPIAYDGVVPGLLIGKFDMIASGMTINTQRNLKVNFTSPFIRVGQTLLIRKELSDTVKSYKDLNDAKYKITSQLGTTGETIVKKYLTKAHYYGYNSEAEALIEVINGKADAFIFDNTYNIIALQKFGDDKLAHLDKLITTESVAFAIRQGDYDSINWINNFLNQIKHDGTYDHIYVKWFSKTDWLKEME